MKREQRCKDNKTLMRCLTRRGQKKLFYVCDRCGLGAVKDSRRSVEWLPAGAKVKSPPEEPRPLGASRAMIEAPLSYWLKGTYPTQSDCVSVLHPKPSPVGSTDPMKELRRLIMGSKEHGQMRSRRTTRFVRLNRSLVITALLPALLTVHSSLPTFWRSHFTM